LLACGVAVRWWSFFAIGFYFIFRGLLFSLTTKRQNKTCRQHGLERRLNAFATSTQPPQNLIYRSHHIYKTIVGPPLPPFAKNQRIRRSPPATTPAKRFLVI